MACHLMLNSTRFGVFLFICSTWLECNWWMWGMHVYICRWISIFLDLWDFTCILRAWIISSYETPVLGMEGVELASTGQIGGVVQERAGPQNGPVDALNQCNSQVVWAVAFLNVSVYSFYLWGFMSSQWKVDPKRGPTASWEISIHDSNLSFLTDTQILPAG